LLGGELIWRRNEIQKEAGLIEATQWFESGNHPEDDREWFIDSEGVKFLGEGKIVGYFRHPNVSGEKVCGHCGKTMHVHGWIDTGGDGWDVCPGDWIITGLTGKHYPCKPDIFEKTYEAVEDKCTTQTKAGE